MTRHPPVAYIAGTLAAQESRIPSHELAAAIVARLDREGFAIVPRDSDGAAYRALAELDATLGLRETAGDEELVREWATQLGMESPSGLMATLVSVRDVLDGGMPA